MLNQPHPSPDMQKVKAQHGDDVPKDGLIQPVSPSFLSASHSSGVVCSKSFHSTWSKSWQKCTWFMR